MKKLNQKGFTGLEVVAAVVIGSLIFTLVAPIIGPILKLGGVGTTQKSVQKEVVTSTTTPVLVAQKPIFTQNTDGTFSMIQETKTVTSTSDDTTPVQAPLWERIVGWFVKLGFLGLVLALAFPTVAVTAWIWIRGRWNALISTIEAHKADFAALEADTKKIVIGMEKAFSAIPGALASIKLPGEINLGDAAQKVEDAMKLELEKFYNDSTKNLVDGILDPTTNTTTTAPTTTAKN